MTSTQGELSLQRARRLKIVLLLSSSYFGLSIITVLTTGSLALLSEAGHVLADIGGIALALFAVIYTRKPATPQRTYGFYRMEILASFVNSLILALLSVYILYEAFGRIFEPPQIESFPIIIVAAVGLVLNFSGMLLLNNSRHHHHHPPIHNNHSDDNTDRQNEQEEILNFKAVYLEILSDTIGAAGVIAAGMIMLTTKFYLADPIISIVLALFMIPRTWSIMKKAIHILMEGSPYNIPHERVKEAILGIKGVTGVFELHIWTITSGMNSLSAHVVVIDTSKAQAILQEINAILEKEFKITHSTIQIETYHQEESGKF
ncbi:MAG TPA: cation diffusion facilitator family transporter [Nitrososphaeraceae archaeon]|nr:cation diffusion facilitator family transporter [Nitrososphaeraceae archaeon]